MRYIVLLGCLGSLLTGCSKPPGVASQAPVPIASGQLIHYIFAEDAAPDGTNAVFKFTHRTFTEGQVAVYESGVVVITEPDGTKHSARLGEVTGLSFR